ncbi:hypothetical protein [Entomomonas asaccharolytica]|uniref:DUF4149 domain-containing protein n=1 Tax=Entomomonas asaccharolytica TaxID=2785331 RepID=A0A974RXQ3_9GAMM|nr:hypothetical protein [Entomomonas asaccharolytica]QQP86377.1 hypothetical protein JHT90_03800 [Entomomonas asaccharolytica]
MSNKRLNSVERFAWAFLQSLWVGGIWITLLVIFPTINQSVLAPILAYNVIAELEPRIVLIILVCVVLQLYLFIKTSGFNSLFKSSIGLTILAVLLSAIVFLGVNNIGLLGYKLRGFLYFAIALLGLFLMFHLPPWLQKQREL